MAKKLTELRKEQLFKKIMRVDTLLSKLYDELQEYGENAWQLPNGTTTLQHIANAYGATQEFYEQTTI